MDIAPEDEGNALKYASRRGSSACVDMLIKAGADVNATDSYDCTPLTKAAGRGHDK